MQKSSVPMCHSDDVWQWKPEYNNPKALETLEQTACVTLHEGIFNGVHDRMLRQKDGYKATHQQLMHLNEEGQKAVCSMLESGGRAQKWCEVALLVIGGWSYSQNVG